MKKFLLLLSVLLTGVSGAWADTQSYTVTYELVSSGRTYSKYYQDNTANTNLWCNRWEVRGNDALTTFPENIPGAFISSDGYCISGWDSKLKNDGSETNIITIHALGTGVVTGYTLTGSVVDARSDKSTDFTKTITPSTGGDAVTWTTADNTSKTVSVTGLSANTATFTLSGTNNGEVRLLPTNFQMTMELTLLSNNSDIDVNKYYYIACPRGGLSTNSGQLASTFKNSSYTMKPFVFVESGGNYYLYSLEDNKYVNESGALTDTPSNAIEINTTGKVSDKYPTYLKIGTNYLRTSDYQTTYGVNTSTLTSGDAGNYYAIMEGGSLTQYYKDRIDAYHGLGGITSTGIDDKSGFAAIYKAYTDAIEDVEGKFFKLQNYEVTSKFLYVTGSNVTTTETADDALVQFRFMSDGSVAIFGGKNQKYVGSTSQSAQAAAVDSPVEYDVEYDSGKGYAFHYTSGNYRAYLHCAASQSYNVVGWSTDATATWWTVTEVDAITYILKENDEEFLRSSRGTTVGATITALPADLQRVFTNYTYPVASLTTVAGANEFVANITFNMPFTASTDYATAQWYYVKMNRTKYAIYSESAPYALNTTQNLTANGMWAFIGNPYTGIKVINKAAGDGKYLQATATQPSMTTTPTSWTIGENGGNFTLHVSDNNYINDYQGQGSMKYWNDSQGATVDGSTFIVEEAEPTIVISKATGTYYRSNSTAISNPDEDENYWGPTWKSTRTISANNLLTLTTSSGMNARNSDIYTGAEGAAQRYTLTAAAGYIITGYSVTGTANSTDVTITPRIRKNLTIGKDESGTLSVTDLDLKTTSFMLSGANSTQGSLSSVTLSVTLKPTATISYTPPVANNTTATIGYKHIASTARYMTYMKADAGGVVSANQVSTTFDAAPSTVAAFTFEYNSDLRAYYIKETASNKYVYAKDDLTWTDNTRTTTNVAALGVDDLPDDDEGKTIFQWTIDDGGTSVGQASYYIRPKSNINTAISIQSMTAGTLGFYDLATKNYDFAHASLITWEQQVGLYYTSARSSNVMKAGKVGYPRTESTAYTNLYGLISTFIGGHTYTQSDYTNLLSYYDAYIAATDIQKPIDGKVYSLINVQAGGTTMFYLNDNDGTLTPTAYTEGETVLPESAEFVCHVTDGDRYVFVSKNGRYMQGAAAGAGGAALATSYNSSKQDVDINKFPSADAGNVSGTSPDFAFGRVWMQTEKGATRIYTTDFNIKGSDGSFQNCSDAYLKGGLSTVYQIVARDDYYNKVNLTSDGTDAYASIYLPFPVTIPDGVTAYAVESENGTYAHMEPIVTNGILPKEKAAILKKDGQTENSTIYLSPAEGDGSYTGDNLLRGTVAAAEAKPGEGTTYVLGKKDVIGLYEYTAAYLAPGKAYLNTAVAGVKALAFDFGDVDGIKTINEESFAGKNIFNLAGQRMNKLQRGMNIVNGKIIVK